MWKEEIDKYFAIMGGVGIALGAMYLLPKEAAMTVVMMVLSGAFALAGTGKKNP